MFWATEVQFSNFIIDTRDLQRSIYLYPNTHRVEI
jgi:hypothetical protein